MDGLGQQSNLTHSKEEDVFSNLTISNNNNSNAVPPGAANQAFNSLH